MDLRTAVRCGSAAVFFEILFCFEGSHAAGSRSGYGLTVAAVLHVAAGEDAGDAGEDVVMGFDIAVLIEVELAGENSSVGDVADAEEEAADVEDGLHARGGVEDTDAGDLFRFDAENLLDDGVGHECDFGVGDGAVEHDAGGAEMLAAMDEGDFGGEAGEEESFFHG